ncbi:peptide deformylase [Succinatimonas hippei]|uniref:peptide deformylase n=1 Tax=Succinatimonas hippei TaxID=626938 RepID=UPI0020121176|nr:peptide deformylase [Succinatimonas hippei]MCL1602719.1 peptide deformylase [Succinatimonas hippei]
MAIREIVTFPDERLRQICAPVTEFDAALKELTDDMFETMYDDEGIGLAAPQIGIEKRIVVIDIPEEDGKQGKNKLVLINPKITAKEGEVASEEGCLSVPEYRAEIKRYEKITLECQDLNGQKQIYEADGLLAICMQHELDHLDGKLFIDYLSRLKRDRLLTKYRKLKKGQARAHE